MLDDLLKQTHGKMESVINQLRQELTKFHTGKAQSTLVEDIMVDVYNSRMPLKQLATITTPEPMQLVITPWDKGNITQIEAAVRSSDLHVNPSSDGTMIRITLPPMSTERRLELVKAMHKKAEEARVALRQIREEVWKQIKEAEGQGKLTEDDRYLGEEKLNKSIAEYNGQVVEMVEGKERELLG